MADTSRSASMSAMRAFLRHSACASSDITPCSSFGMMMSRISTDSTVMPQSVTFASTAS